MDVSGQIVSAYEYSFSYYFTSPTREKASIYFVFFVVSFFPQSSLSHYLEKRVLYPFFFFFYIIRSMYFFTFGGGWFTFMRWHCVKIISVGHYLMKIVGVLFGVNVFYFVTLVIGKVVF